MKEYRYETDIRWDTERSVSRRKFLKIGAGAALGFASPLILAPVVKEIILKTEELTRKPAGNAGRTEKVEAACPDTDLSECLRSYEISESDKFIGSFLSPASEELAFRFVPSIMVEDSNYKDPYDISIEGSDTLGMTRREILVGVASSIIFGLVHNVTDKGINTKYIPSTQAFLGFVYWWLQRKFGVLSNYAAHASWNFLSLYRPFRKI